MIEDTELLQKIVNMAFMGVPDTQIADAMDLSPGRISQIKDTPEYKSAFAIKHSERIEHVSKFNNKWDELEELAIGNVITAMKWNKDAEFSLKAATLANRANRRGGDMNNTPLPAQMGGRLAISLSMNFIQKLQMVTQEAARPNFGGQMKVVQETGVIKKTNLLSPSAVVDMFKPKLEKELFTDADNVLQTIDA